MTAAVGFRADPRVRGKDRIQEGMNDLHRFVSLGKEGLSQDGRRYVERGRSEKSIPHHARMYSDGLRSIPEVPRVGRSYAEAAATPVSKQAETYSDGMHPIPEVPRVGRSYAEAVGTSRVSKCLFVDFPLVRRRIQLKDGVPLVAFTEAEVRPAYRSMEHAVVLKFSPNRPRLEEIREFVRVNWPLRLQPVVGALDGKHALLICAGEEDATKIIACDSNRMGNALFRTFRWMPGFSVKAEPSSMVAWIRLHGLDPCFYRNSFLGEVCLGVGSFLKADERTLCLQNPAVARVCVEIDLKNPLVQGFWVSAGRRLQWIEVEYEGRMEFCRRCRKHGHSVEECRREQARRNRSEEGIKRVPIIQSRVPHRKGEGGRLAAEVSEKHKGGSGPEGGFSQQWQTYDGRKRSQRVPVKKVYVRKTLNEKQVLVAELDKVAAYIPPSVCDSGQVTSQISVLRGQSRETENQKLMFSELSMPGSQPELGIRNCAIYSTFMKRLQESWEDFMIRMYDSSRSNVAPTTYNRMISRDDSELG
uniref:DUF4283 domain-containing protein n=1 Tax=Kalanchoe fedtschenkoi TaxID=63787 RepID=A0A7N0VDC2_KALFE